MQRLRSIWQRLCRGAFGAAAHRRLSFEPCYTAADRVAVRSPLSVRRSGQRRALLALALWLPGAVIAATPPGTVISNTAQADFTIGAAPFRVLSNPLAMTTDVVHTPATIELLQYSPTGVGRALASAPSACAQGGASGPFVDPGAPGYPGSGALEVNDPLALVPATRYHRGEPVFVRLADADRNLDDTVREIVEVTVTARPGGDVERLRLSETTPASGEFVGYIASGGAAVTAFDCVLSVSENSTVEAAYTDPFDPSDSVNTSVLVDPFGIVFDSATGAPVNGITVRLIDAATGAPARVFGDDGASDYPATLTSGGTAADGSGQVYAFPAGGYRFPFVAPGSYRLELATPVNYAAPSQRTEAELQALPGAPFALDARASFGSDFVLNAGPPLNIDVPVDPLNSQLFLRKQANRERAALGDFVHYTLELSNTHPSVAAGNVVIRDLLPASMRYVPGSARRDGVTMTEPLIDAGGRRLDFDLGALAPNSSVRVTYVTRIAASSPVARAVNTASASASGLVSNAARASVRIEDDLLRAHSRILGRVVLGCERGETPRAGIAGVRLLMEDGRYAITDEQGQYHFEGLTPGSHVVQIDTDSLPAHLELAECDRDTRVAGSPHSRFVDLRGASLWRVDFQVREKAPLEGQVSIRMRSTLVGDELHYRITLGGDTVTYRNRRLSVMLPEGLDYLAGTSTLDGAVLDDPEAVFGALTYRLGDAAGGARWEHELRLRAALTPQAAGELAAQALLTFDTLDANNQRTGVVDNRLLREPARHGEESYVFRPRFASLQASLNAADRAELDAVIAELRGKTIRKVSVTGHTDDMPIAARNRHRFADNYALSLARAQSVADYLATALGLVPGQVSINGLGPDYPVAPNDDEAGRALNRRVELCVETYVQKAAEWRDLVRADSGPAPRSVSERRRSRPARLPRVPGAAATPAGELPALGETLSWREPAPDFLPPIPSLTVAVAHDPATRVVLALNGEPVPAYNFDGVKREDGGRTAVSVWRGVDLGAAENRLEAVALAADGSERGRLQRLVHYAGGPRSVELVPEYSHLVADGRTPVVVAVRLRDARGVPVRQDLVGEFHVAPPHLPLQTVQALQEGPLGPNPSARYRVLGDGIAQIELAPTQQPGRVNLTFPLADGDSAALEAWLQPQARDWVLVGIAEGTTGYNTLSGNMAALEDRGIDEDLYYQGRVAFYAKGRIKGEWLLTMAYDTAKEVDREADGLQQHIDPRRFYTLYGDRSEQRFDAASARKLYLRLEREQFYALFGDYDTGLTLTELGRYSRSMTGLKSEYAGERWRYNAFASETDQTFVRDEIRGDGTSGLYRLSQGNLVLNSEKVTIETRDRFRSERVIESRELVRFIDYSLDPVDGTVFFREPVYSQDANFNPVYIVVDYEVLGSAGRNTNAGGRGAVRLLDGALELGATLVHEEAEGGGGDLGALDLKLALSDTLGVRAEVAASDSVDAGNDRDGSAHLAEVYHDGERLQARAYLRRQQSDFGLGQQRGGETGTRKAGSDARYRLGERTSLVAEAWHEEVETTGAQRDVAAAGGEYQGEDYSLAAGLRRASDEDGAGTRRTAELLTLGAGRALLDRRLRLRGNAELAIGDNDNSDFPQRFITGADYRLSSAVELFAEHEITDGEDIEANATRLGLRSRPWDGAVVRSSVEDRLGEEGARTFSNLGMTQNVHVNERLSLDFGLDRTDTLRGGDAAPFNSNVPGATGSAGNDFTAYSLGATYRQALWSASSRFERREAEQDDKTGVFAGFYRQQTPGFGFSLSAQYNATEYRSGSESALGNLRFSAALRPLDRDWIVLERLDLDLEEMRDGAGGDTRTRKIVNNTNLNYRPDERNQLALAYGLKYALDTFEGRDYDGWTQLLGGEYRRDIDSHWDLGVQAGVLHVFDADNYEYSFGVSAGVNLGRNLWLSFGYNIEGFHDSDFTGASYMAEGPYLKLRAALDQHNAREFIEWWRRDDGEGR